MIYQHNRIQCIKLLIYFRYSHSDYDWKFFQIDVNLNNIEPVLGNGNEESIQELSSC